MATKTKASPKRIDWTPETILRFRTEHRFSLSTFGRLLGAISDREKQRMNSRYGISNPSKHPRIYSRQAINGWEKKKFSPSFNTQRALDIMAQQEGFTG